MSDIKLQVLPPHESVKHWVSRVLITTGSPEGKTQLPIGPSGFSYLTYSRHSISLHYSSRTLTNKEQLYVAGQLKKEQPYFDFEGEIFHIGLELMPQTLYYLYGIEGEVLVDNVMTFKELNDQSDQYVREMNECEDPLHVAGIMQRILAGASPKHECMHYVDNAVKIIFEKGGCISLEELVDVSGVSERTFRRMFKKVIGLSPKQYCKIIQFNAVFEAIQTNDEKALFDLALTCGYYDQAHFINDFRTFLGQSPSQFIKSGHDFLKDYLGAVKQAG
jgi:AraC-like DNA-binding protein